MIVNITYWSNNEIVGQFHWKIDGSASVTYYLCKLKESVNDLPVFLGRDITSVSISLESEVVRNETEDLFN